MLCPKCSEETNGCEYCDEERQLIIKQIAVVSEVRHDTIYGLGMDSRVYKWSLSENDWVTVKE